MSKDFNLNFTSPKMITMVTTVVQFQKKNRIWTSDGIQRSF